MYVQKIQISQGSRCDLARGASGKQGHIHHPKCSTGRYTSASPISILPPCSTHHGATARYQRVTHVSHWRMTASKATPRNPRSEKPVGEWSRTLWRSKTLREQYTGEDMIGRRSCAILLVMMPRGNISRSLMSRRVHGPEG